MPANNTLESTRFRAYGPRHLDTIARRYGLPPDLLDSMRSTSLVLPFRVNDYVLDNLIDWRNVPDDPIFQLTFPQPGMLTGEDERQLAVSTGSGRREVVTAIRGRLNPHPSAQASNVPVQGGEAVPGLQHKYRETVLYFPGQGQTCHTYCTYCFRWAQFVGDPGLRFAAADPSGLIAYLRVHPEVCDVLVTGGDPMVMSADRLRSHLTPLLALDTVRTIRIGTKSVAYWPHRFTTDSDAGEVARLFEDIVASGRHLAVMAHVSHPRELATGPARRALRRIRATGAAVYGQAPLIAHVNDDATVIGDLWRSEYGAGVVPYYLFVARDTGPHGYFKVPLAKALDIFQTAYRTLPGLARTVRGPVMSASPGKVVVDGVEETSGDRHFQLRMVQARDPALVGRPFRARYSATAAWLDELDVVSAVPRDLAAAFRSTASRP
ncbi:KamA family radical SAM protein [Actinoplanes sp. NPDC049265]|uniref:KamA family radical SAM protein n=1 Tax=Actinoplanes sp. NPDC049265 TaxID=3363902 RepID=UPI003718CCD2